jgi:hypothetical protein
MATLCHKTDLILQQQTFLNQYTCTYAGYFTNQYTITKETPASSNTCRGSESQQGPRYYNGIHSFVVATFEQCHDKTNIMGLRPAWIQTSLRIRAV